MSDMESASDYEVIAEDPAADETMMGSLQFRALDEALERMTNSTRSTGSSPTAGDISSTEEEQPPPLMLASVNHLAPSYNNSGETEDSIISSLHFSFQPVQKPEELEGETDLEDDTDDSILAAHREVKKVLLDTMEQMEMLKNWKEEKSELLDRVATLEGTVDRLSKKNNALQKVNENGTLFDRRRKDKERATLERSEVDEEIGTIGEPNLPVKEISTKVKIFLAVIYSLIIGVAVYYNQQEADKKIQALEIQIRSERWNSDQLLARIILLENRLNASFDEIQKLNSLLYSPYSADIFTIPADNDEAVSQEMNCFLRVNSSSFRLCQGLAEDLEKEAHENNRLKEQVSMVQRAISAALPPLLALFATLLVFSVKYLF